MSLKFLLLSLAFSVASAGAMPYASPQQLVRPEASNEDLLHQVNLVVQVGRTSYVDPRGVISVMGPKIGMSPAEIQQARGTTGYVICPGTQNNNGAISSAALIGDGGQLITNVHAFIDDNTGLRREPLAECFFQNQAEAKDVIPLDFSGKTYKFFTESPQREFYFDVAVVRLTRKIPGARPFAADFNGAPIRESQSLIMISADQERMSSPPAKIKQNLVIAGKNFAIPYNREPIVQKCMAVNVAPSTGVYPTLIYSDCSGTLGASGSILLVRMSGTLMIKGVHAMGGLDSADYKPYKQGQGVPDGDRSFAFAIGLDSFLGGDIVAFGLEK